MMANCKLVVAGLVMIGSLILQQCAVAQTAVTAKQLSAKQLSAKNLRVLSSYSFKSSKAKIIAPRSTQATTTEEEDGDPTGPNTEFNTDLVDLFEPSSPKYIRADFEAHIPFARTLFRDHTSLNTFYFYPAGYLLEYDATDGFDINFLHRTRADESQEELIVLNFTLQTRRLNGGMSLLQELAQYAIKPANDKPVSLQRLPVDSVRVDIAGLSSLIPEENVKIINSPSMIGDPIRVQATLTQSQKEDVVASIRDGGVAGRVIFTTNNNSVELEIPYFVSFTDFAGQWITDISQLDTTDSIKNLSPYPLMVSGVVVYAKSKTGNKLHRHQIPFVTPVVLEAGAVARADKSFAELVSSYGEVVSAWPVIKRVICDECLNVIERDILVSPAQASRTNLPIEAIPNIFDQFSLFKVLVEVRSSLFSPNNEFSEVKNFTLRADATEASVTLYVNRDNTESISNFEYRIKPFHNEGLNLPFTDWKPDNGVMDITVTAGDIRPLMPEQDTVTAKPEQDTDSAKPEQDTDSAIPEQDTDTAIPKQDTDTAIPEQDTDTAIPEQDTDTAIPEQ
ncbi:hypothetical protein, partial [Candidatus Nitrotoga sp. M5]|uniref:hypothetical protein n=1 Tax=Candidatus Nitrotoga sp. M5 TaxID=2890409 RepID=UPI001EF19EF9